MKFRALVLELHLSQKFCHTHTHTQTDRHFREIVKSCLGHPKMRKSIKKWNSEICTKPILTSNFIDFARFHTIKAKLCLSQ